MKKPPIAIDFDIIFDPYKMLTVIEAIDHNYSEIILPFNIQHADIIFPSNYFCSIDILETSKFWDNLNSSYYKCGNEVHRNNFAAGVLLLQMANKKGMISVIDAEKSISYEGEGQNYLFTEGHHFLDFHTLYSKEGNKIIICGDSPSYDALIGMQLDGYEVLYGNHLFVSHWHETFDPNSADTLLIPDTPFSTSISATLEKIIYQNKITSIEEAFNIVSESNSVKKMDLFARYLIDKYDKKKDISLMCLEHIATTYIDDKIGYPVASTAMVGYHLVQRLLKKN